MGFENSPEKTLIITQGKENISISTTDNKNDESTITLTEFFNNICQLEPKNNCINLENIKILELTHCELTNLPTFENLHLTHLNLAHNKLTEVPVCIYSGLQELEVLNLSHNSISSFDFPPQCVLKLKIVKLNHNLFVNIPKWIMEYQSINLEELNFSHNEVKYVCRPDTFKGHSSKLKKIKLRNSNLIDADFYFFKYFKHLQYIDISNKYQHRLNVFYDADSLFVKLKWKDLKVLKMNNLSLSFFPEGIPWIESLTELYLNKNSISWFPDGIEYLVNLEVLEISENHLISIPDNLIQLELLKVLKANHNVIERCPDFSLMKNLKVLDLYDNSLDSVSFKLECLEAVDLDNNYFDANDLPDYALKKVKLNRAGRINGIKPKPYYDDYDTKSSDAYSDGDTQENLIDATQIDDTEDWDIPTPSKEKNPDVDTDDDWDDKEVDWKYRKVIDTKKVYVEDEDWMFEDVEES